MNRTVAVRLFIVASMLGVIGCIAIGAIQKQWFLPLVVTSALIDSINPCAISVLLLTIGFLVSLGRTFRNILAIGGTYVFGIFISYFFIGLGILQTLSLFGVPHVAAKIGAMLLFLAGTITLANHFNQKFPIKLKIPQMSHKYIALLVNKGSLPAAFFLGMLVGLFEFPCTGGPYLSVLGLLHDKSTYISGLWYLLLYNAIFVFPLVVILLLSGDKAVSEKVLSLRKRHGGNMRLVSGLIMLTLSAIIYLL